MPFTEEDFRLLSVRELRKLLHENGIDTRQFIEVSEFVQAAVKTGNVLEANNKDPFDYVSNLPSLERFIRQAGLATEMCKDRSSLILRAKQIRQAASASSKVTIQNLKDVDAVLMAQADHEALGFTSAKEITSGKLKAAFRFKSLRVHPDKNNAQGANEAFSRVKEIFDRLKVRFPSDDTAAKPQPQQGRPSDPFPAQSRARDPFNDQYRARSAAQQKSAEEERRRRREAAAEEQRRREEEEIRRKKAEKDERRRRQVAEEEARRRQKEAEAELERRRKEQEVQEQRRKDELRRKKEEQERKVMEQRQKEIDEAARRMREQGQTAQTSTSNATPFIFGQSPSSFGQEANQPSMTPADLTKKKAHRPVKFTKPSFVFGAKEQAFGGSRSENKTGFNGFGKGVPFGQQSTSSSASHDDGFAAPVSPSSLSGKFKANVFVSGRGSGESFGEPSSTVDGSLGSTHFVNGENRTRGSSTSSKSKPSKDVPFVFGQPSTDSSGTAGGSTTEPSFIFGRAASQPFVFGEAPAASSFKSQPFVFGGTTDASNQQPFGFGAGKDASKQQPFVFGGASNHQPAFVFGQPHGQPNSQPVPPSTFVFGSNAHSTPTPAFTFGAKG